MNRNLRKDFHRVMRSAVADIADWEHDGLWATDELQAVGVISIALELRRIANMMEEARDEERERNHKAESNEGCDK